MPVPKSLQLTEEQLWTLLAAAFSAGDECGKEIERSSVQEMPNYTEEETKCVVTLLGAANEKIASKIGQFTIIDGSPNGIVIGK